MNGKANTSKLTMYWCLDIKFSDRYTEWPMKTYSKYFYFFIFFLCLVISALCLTAYPQSGTTSPKEAEAQKFYDAGNKAEAARLYNQIAYEKRTQGNNNKSIEYYKKVLSINNELGNRVGQMLTHSNLSMLYIEIEKYSEALEQLELELKFRQQGKNPKEIIPVLISISGVQNELSRFEEASEKALDAIGIAKEVEDLPLLKRAYGIAYDVYNKWGKQSEAQSYFDLYSAIDRKIKEDRMSEVQTQANAKVNEANIEKAKTEEQLNVKSKELEKTVVSLEEAERVAKQQQMELDLQQAQINEQNALLRVETLRKRYFAMAFIVTLLFLVALVFLVLRIRKANMKINAQRLKLEKQNREIHASIRYAKTIQTAMLPDAKTIEGFADHFVIYRPKDIVSGDFYWAQAISENTLFYAVVDCTGHGVPGAFMSMIGLRMLDEIVNEMKIDSPAQILETLNELLREALRQEQTDNNDGMDLAICRLDKDKDGNIEVTYSGAKRPLYVGRKSKMELEVFHPDRKSIGGYQPTKRYIEFNNHTVKVNKGDVLYMFSDGIVDQNDPHRKKFGRARLENILKSLIDSEMERQKTVIETKLDEFIQDEAQRDDITFSGLQIK